MFRLAVTVVEAPDGNARQDPVVYVAGGPGSPLTIRAALLARHEAGVVAPDRDLILVDQRGAGRSEPAICPDLARQQLAIFARGADEGTLVEAWRRSYATCRQQMTPDGLQPDWFGTQITAADFDTVRQALGIERWNVYAISYGTAVAMTMMALYPDTLRAVVLDSVFPPDPLPVTLPQSFARALGFLFAACQSDARCATLHPDLAEAYAEAVRTLDAAPLAVPAPPGIGFDTFSLRAELFRLVVNRALYSREGMAALPSFIDAVRDRRPAAIQPVLGAVANGYLAMAAGDLAAVECRDRPSWREPGLPPPGGDQPVSAFVSGMCDGWSAPGPPPLLPEGSPVASLLLAGTVDPITPPVFARGAAAALGAKASVVEFSHVGHGAQQSSACAEAIVTAFIRDPSGPLATGCAPQVPPVAFR